MRTTPALRTLTAALVTGGSLVAAAAGTTAAASGGSGGSGGPIWGTVVSGSALNVRAAPTTNSYVVDQLSPGSQDRVECMVQGQSIRGNPYWYWLVGAQGWASAAYVDTGRAWVPSCSDPCPQWKDGSWSNWDDPYVNDQYPYPYSNDSWSVSGSGSWSASGSWSWSAAGW